jgi:putative acetyltransferase
VEHAIRAEQQEDRDAIAQVVGRAFESQIEVRLVDAIRASENFVPEWSLVALAGDEIVGHVLVSYVTLQDVDAKHRICSLAPLAVDPAHQRTGVGSDLARAVIKIVDEAGEPLIVLEGHPDYYPRFGFELANPLGIIIDLPSWAPPEAAQVRRLTKYDPSIRGRVVYPPAFDDVAEH